MWLWRVNSCLQWYKNYKNPTRDVRRIVENKVTPFFRTPCSSCCLLASSCLTFVIVSSNLQGDHLYRKPGNVKYFDSCRGNVGILHKVREISRKKFCQGKVTKNCYLLVAYLLLCVLHVLSVTLHHFLRFGAVGSDVGQINEVTLRWARLVLG